VRPEDQLPEREHRRLKLAPPRASIEGHNLTDLGNARRMVELHGDDFRWCGPWGRFVVYDGKRWKQDDTGAVERMAKDTVRSIYQEAADAGDGDRRKALAKHATRSEAANRLQAMIGLTRSEPGIPVLPADLDGEPWLLNVENGTLDLRSGKLREQRREGLITKLAPVEYDPEAQAPTWEAFLKRVLPSEALRRFVQRAIGYSLTGSVEEQILLFLYGTGANGKSTLVNAVLELLGDYGKQAAPDLLVVKQGAHPTELADLFGARFVASVEVEDGRRLAESLVKQLTGGDKIKARYMRQDFWEFSPTHKIFLAANHRPTVRGTDHAIWRRIKLVPFDVTIPKEEQDPRLPERLREELPGILAWAVRGCLEWQHEGLGEPEEVRSATESYRAEMDVLAAFLEDRCVVDPNATVGATPLWNAYQEWCRETGEYAGTQTAFGRRLRERGFESGRHPKNRKKEWRGIGLLYPGDPGGTDPEGVTVGGGVTVRNASTALTEQNSSHVQTNTETVTNRYGSETVTPDYNAMVEDRIRRFEEEGL
jgi:putative DNA primase/helicase